MKAFFKSAFDGALRGALIGLALAGSLLAPLPASALTFPPSYAPRQVNLDLLHVYRKTFNFNDANIATGVQFGSIPVNSYIYDTRCNITTAFNAGTTNTVSVGVTQSSANELLTTGTTTAGQYTGVAANMGLVETGSASGNYLGIPTAEGGVGLWVKYAQTGTAATTGSATCVVLYFPPIDQ